MPASIESGGIQRRTSLYLGTAFYGNVVVTNGESERPRCRHFRTFVLPSGCVSDSHYSPENPQAQVILVGEAN